MRAGSAFTWGFVLGAVVTTVLMLVLIWILLDIATSGPPFRRLHPFAPDPGTLVVVVREAP